MGCPHGTESVSGCWSWRICAPASPASVTPHEHGARLAGERESRHQVSLEPMMPLPGSVTGIACFAPLQHAQRGAVRPSPASAPGPRQHEDPPRPRQPALSAQALHALWMVLRADDAKRREEWPVPPLVLLERAMRGRRQEDRQRAQGEAGRRVPRPARETRSSPGADHALRAGPARGGAPQKRGAEA